jgi:hypothetical protein
MVGPVLSRFRNPVGSRVSSHVERSGHPGMFDQLASVQDQVACGAADVGRDRGCCQIEVGVVLVVAGLVYVGRGSRPLDGSGNGRPGETRARLAVAIPIVVAGGCGRMRSRKLSLNPRREFSRLIVSGDAAWRRDRGWRWAPSYCR